MIRPDEWTAWLRFRDIIAGILDPRLYTIDWLEMQVLTGAYRIWHSDKAIILAGLKTYPTGKQDVEGIVAAGDAEEIVSLIPKAEQWGRERGCIGALIESREGWARVMKPHGYRLFQTTIRKEY